MHTQSSPRAVNGNGLPPRSVGANAPSPGLSTFSPSPHSSSEAEVEPLSFSGQLAVEPQLDRLESHRLSNQPKIRNLDLDGEPVGSHNRYLGTSDQRREPEQNGEADFRNSYFYDHTPSYTGTAPYVIDDSVIGVPFQVFDDPSEEIAFMYCMAAPEAPLVTLLCSSVKTSLIHQRSADEHKISQMSSGCPLAQRRMTAQRILTGSSLFSPSRIPSFCMASSRSLRATCTTVGEATRLFYHRGKLGLSTPFEQH